MTPPLTGPVPGAPAPAPAPAASTSTQPISCILAGSTPASPAAPSAMLSTLPHEQQQQLIQQLRALLAAADQGTSAAAAAAIAAATAAHAWQQPNSAAAAFHAQAPSPNHNQQLQQQQQRLALNPAGPARGSFQAVTTPPAPPQAPRSSGPALFQASPSPAAAAAAARALAPQRPPALLAPALDLHGQGRTSGPFPAGTFPGPGSLSGCSFPGSTLSGGPFPGSSLTRGAFPGSSFPGGSLQGGYHQGSLFPDGCHNGPQGWLSREAAAPAEAGLPGHCGDTGPQHNPAQDAFLPARQQHPLPPQGQGNAAAPGGQRSSRGHPGHPGHAASGQLHAAAPQFPPGAPPGSYAGMPLFLATNPAIPNACAACCK